MLTRVTYYIYRVNKSAPLGKEPFLPILTAVVKNVVGKHYFLAVFGPIDAHFSSQPLRQPHGMTISHIVKLNHTVIKKELKLG